MAERGCGVLGNLFDDCSILFFILVFLLLFYRRGYGYGPGC